MESVSLNNRRKSSELNKEKQKRGRMCLLHCVPEERYILYPVLYNYEIEFVSD